MRYLEKVKDMLERELEDFANKGSIDSLEELKAIDKLTHSIKSIETIMAMRKSEYSHGSWHEKSVEHPEEE